MTFKYKNYTLAFITLAILVASFLFSSKLHAAVISPDKYYIDIQNTNQTLQKLIIYATPNQDKALTYKIRPIGIKKTGEKNERSFYEPDSVDKQDATNWLNILDQEVTVEPGSTAEVRWSLSVPSDFTCETKLTGIAVSEVAKDDGTKSGANVSINNEVISQIHINTTRSGDSNCEYYENLILQDFSTVQSIPVFNYDNIDFKTTIENRSDYLSKNIKGFIELFGFGGKQVVEFNDTNLDIYPHSLRSFSNTWIDPNYPRGNFFDEIIYEFTHFKFGIYTVRLGITKNIETPIIATTTIFILPIRAILIILISVTLLAIIIRNNYKTRKELKLLKSKSGLANSTHSRKL